MKVMFSSRTHCTLRIVSCPLSSVLFGRFCREEGGLLFSLFCMALVMLYSASVPAQQQQKG